MKYYPEILGIVCFFSWFNWLKAVFFCSFVFFWVSHVVFLGLSNVSFSDSCQLGTPRAVKNL